MKYKPNAGDYIKFNSLDFCPLPVIKQILAMFCSVNQGLHNDKQFSGFLLNKYSNDFDNSKYKVYMYAFAKGIERKSGFVAQGNLISKEVTRASEIAAYPLGFILSTAGDCSKFGADISSFATKNYDDKCTLELCMPVHECNTVFPLDYRTQSQINADILRNKELETILGGL